jgi:hypothetical protein
MVEELLSALHDEGLAAVAKSDGIFWETGSGCWRITDGDAGVDFDRPEAVFCAIEFNDIEDTSRIVCYVKDPHELLAAIRAEREKLKPLPGQMEIHIPVWNPYTDEWS